MPGAVPSVAHNERIHFWLCSLFAAVGRLAISFIFAGEETPASAPSLCLLMQRNVTENRVKFEKIGFVETSPQFLKLFTRYLIYDFHSNTCLMNRVFALNSEGI